MDCRCDSCVSACRNMPGIFIPSELEGAALLKGLTVQEFFDTYCVVDFYNKGNKEVFYIRPANHRENEGGMSNFNPRGRCIFLVERLCDIHANKPSMCAWYDCTKSENEGLDYKFNYIVPLWDNPEAQALCETLLGHKPYIVEPSSFSEMFLL